MSLLEKIVSGGQTGADRAALDFAIANGIPHGGWCPAGRKSEDGPIDQRYQLKEAPSSGYIQRTEWNVRDSDGTVVFSIAPELSGGSKKTVFLAHKLGKPVLRISRDGGPTPPEQGLRKFIERHRIKVLNVAGPRGSKEPLVYEFVMDVLQRALKLVTIGPVQYRALRDSEVEQAVELAQRVFTEFVEDQHSSEGCEEFRRYSSAAVLRERHDTGCVTFAAERNGNIIGMLHFRNGNHIAMLFVEGPSQRQGVGSGLVLAAEQYAISQQPPPQALTVASTPNAIDAYRKMGFVPVGNEQVVKGLRFVPMERKIRRRPHL